MTPEPEPAAIAALETIDVHVRNVVVQDGIAELAADVAALIAPYQNKRINSQEIFGLATTIEQAYARRGLILVRVVVPPQRVAEGQTLQYRVVDGFIQRVDVSALPASMRDVVARRLRPLVRRPHLRLRTIERHLLMASDAPGLRLRSTLVAGSEEGATVLVMSGSFERISGGVSLDNRLDRTLGPWEVSGNLALSSALSLGEQLYAYASASNPAQVFEGNNTLQVFGGGLVVPFGSEGQTVAAEYTHSRIQTLAVDQVPETAGVFQRLRLNATLPVLWTRSHVLKASLALESINQRLAAPLFNADLSRDQYRVVRLGIDNQLLTPTGRRIASELTLSRGISGRDAAAALVSGVPLSRAGSRPDFIKLNVQVRFAQPLAAGLRLDVALLGQSAFGQSLMRSEQFSLDGAEALSSFTAGSLSADQGMTLRAEAGRPTRIQSQQIGGVLAPYVFLAFGLGQLNQPTAVESKSVHASAIGVGARAAFGGSGRTDAGLEVGRQTTNADSLQSGWHANLTLGHRF